MKKLTANELQEILDEEQALMQDGDEVISMKVNKNAMLSGGRIPNSGDTVENLARRDNQKPYK